MSVNTQNSGLITDEQTKLVRVADGDIPGSKAFEEQRFDNTQAVGNIRSLAVGPDLGLDRPVSIHVAYRNLRQQHLPPRTAQVLARLRIASRQNYFLPTQATRPLCRNPASRGRSIPRSSANFPRRLESLQTGSPALRSGKSLGAATALMSRASSGETLVKSRVDAARMMPSSAFE
jgi:hypothetical protein